VDDLIDGAEGFVGGAPSGKNEVLHQGGPSDVAYGFQQLVLDLVQAQFVVLAPGDHLKLTVVYAVVINAAPASPEEFFGLVAAVSREEGHGFDRTILWGFSVAVLVVEEEISWLRLRHG
jgi:hypothetical protein